MAQFQGGSPEAEIAPLDKAQRLNRGCFCITLDRTSLATAFDRETGIPGFAEALEQSHPLLFSNVPVFVPAGVLAEMTQVIAAVEAATRLPEYRQAALRWASSLAHRDFGPVGALMGYDFHVTTDGAKLIEINTNAGGAFLNAPLARAQRACCAATPAKDTNSGDFAAEVGSMFQREWIRQRGAGQPRRIAILDDEPEGQFLLPEFKLAQSILQAHGIDTVIGDPRDLARVGDAVTLAGQPIDLVYNRLVDFAFDGPAHSVLREAYNDGIVVVTPNPHIYAMFADKRNLCLLSNVEQLKAWGLAERQIDVLADSTLPTVLVSESNADELWRDRKHLFFKPAQGHASKATYRGEKLTRRVWGEITAGNYIAQAYAEPGLRDVQFDGARVELKVDVRLYTYDGKVMLTAARLYRGQTTNMRTPGGGFAPVLVAP